MSKLNIKLLPYTLHKFNINKYIDKNELSLLQKRLCKNNCIYCGNKSTLLDKIFDYNENIKTQKLLKVNPICKKCDDSIHFGRTYTNKNRNLEYYNEIIEHMKKYMNLTEDEIINLYNKELELCEERSDNLWGINLDILKEYNISKYINVDYKYRRLLEYTDLRSYGRNYKEEKIRHIKLGLFKGKEYLLDLE